MNLTSRNQDPMHASLALSSILHVWYKPNSLNRKSICNTLLLEFYICAKPRLTHWYPCPKKKCHYFCTGVYVRPMIFFFFANFWYCVMVFYSQASIHYLNNVHKKIWYCMWKHKYEESWDFDLTDDTDISHWQPSYGNLLGVFLNKSAKF